MTAAPRTNAAAKALADQIRAEAAEWGVTVTGGAGVITCRADFPAGDAAAYAAAESGCLEVLALVPQIGPGSTWGNTSDGVGGIAAVHTGVCRIKRSGVPRRLTSQFAGGAR
jgi:hypothetical protein